ncbi:MAG: hypothetical protein II670_09495, partial [Alphaproteobacteria bacterium]|nr:hypothetical protein [Alphaproteobacteria bacterium]
KIVSINSFVDIVIQNNCIPVFLFILFWKRLLKCYDIISYFTLKLILISNTIAYGIPDYSGSGILIIVIKNPEMLIMVIEVWNDRLSEATSSIPIYLI